MADRFDHPDHDSSVGSFMMGLLTGMVLGGGLGILFAPKAGSALRNRLSEQADDLASMATDGYHEATDRVGQWVEKGRDAAGAVAEKGKDVYDHAREAVKNGVDEAQRYVRDAASGVAGTPAPTSAGSSGPTGSSGSGYSGGSHSSDSHADSTGA
jgi:gas vesicle protein